MNDDTMFIPTFSYKTVHFYSLLNKVNRRLVNIDRLEFESNKLQ